MAESAGVDLQGGAVWEACPGLGLHHPGDPHSQRGRAAGAVQRAAGAEPPGNKSLLPPHVPALDSLYSKPRRLSLSHPSQCPPSPPLVPFSLFDLCLALVSLLTHLTPFPPTSFLSPSPLPRHPSTLCLRLLSWGFLFHSWATRDGSHPTICCRSGWTTASTNGLTTTAAAQQTLPPWRAPYLPAGSCPAAESPWGADRGSGPRRYVSSPSPPREPFKPPVARVPRSRASSHRDVVG